MTNSLCGSKPNKKVSAKFALKQFVFYSYLHGIYIYFGKHSTIKSIVEVRKTNQRLRRIGAIALPIELRKKPADFMNISMYLLQLFLFGSNDFLLIPWLGIKKEYLFQIM